MLLFRFKPITIPNLDLLYLSTTHPPHPFPSLPSPKPWQLSEFLDVEIGEEFRVAASEAKALNAVLIVGDRPVEVGGRVETKCPSNAPIKHRKRMTIFLCDLVWFPLLLFKKEEIEENMEGKEI